MYKYNRMLYYYFTCASMSLPQWHAMHVLPESSAALHAQTRNASWMVSTYQQQMNNTQLKCIVSYRFCYNAWHVCVHCPYNDLIVAIIIRDGERDKNKME